MNEEACTCGHSPEEHGHDAKNPGSTACGAVVAGDGEEVLCDCIAYECAEDHDASGNPCPKRHHV